MQKNVNRYPLPKVSEIMQKPVLALTEDHTALDALSALNRHKLSSLPVVDEKKVELKGVIAEGDLLKHFAQGIFYDDLAHAKLRDIVNSNVRYVDKEMNIFELEEVFHRYGIRHAPVVEEKKVIGSVSRTDVLISLERFAKDILDYRQSIISPLQLSKYKEMDMRIKELSNIHHFDSLT